MATGSNLVVRGLAERVRDLEQMERRARDLTPVMKVAAQDLITTIDDAFQNSAEPDGTPWEPLSSATIAKRRQGSSKPLVDTGRLRNSKHATANRDGIRWGFSAFYAPFHQWGTADIPQRRFAPVVKSGGTVLLDTRSPVWDRIRKQVEKYVLTGRVR